MYLHNIQSIDTEKPGSLLVQDGKIIAVDDGRYFKGNKDDMLHFENALAFPGLINSHDHLDFNCFPSLGQGIYTNYTSWGNHIHKTYKAEINEVLAIPQALRIQWGIYKNLLGGVTTVVHHGNKIPVTDPVIGVIQPAQNLHSIGFEQNWKWKLNNVLLKNKECVIHIGEGTDSYANNEIDALLQWNILNRPLVGIHALAMGSNQAKKFKGIVWCPASNRFLFNADAAIHQIKENTNVVLGTDSTLTSDWNIWNHLRMARNTKQVTDPELFNTVTFNAAKLWRLSTGKLEAGKHADITISSISEKNNWNGFYNNNPSAILFVMQAGKIRLFDESLLQQLQHMKTDLTNFHPVVINKQIKFVYGNIPLLVKQIRKYNSSITFPVDIIEYETFCG